MFDAMPDAFWTEISRSLLLRPPASTMRPVWNSPRALAGEDERDVRAGSGRSSCRSSTPCRASPSCCRARSCRSPSSMPLSAVEQRGELLGVVAAHDVLARRRRCCARACGAPWSTPWLGQRWPLDAPDSVKATTRVRSHSKASLIEARSSGRAPATAGRSCSCSAPLPVGRVDVGQAVRAAARRAACRARRARRCVAFSTSRQPSTRPSSLCACSESMPSTRLASAMSASRKSIRLFLRSSAARSCVCVGAGLVRVLGADQR